LPGVEGHISYDFTRSLWASLDLWISSVDGSRVD
jgi:hypothetical protein